MKITLLLLAMLTLVAAGCKNTDNNSNSGSTSDTMTNQSGSMPAGGGTRNSQ